jgi:predicted Zn-dependent protease
MRLSLILLMAGSASAIDLRYWIEPCTRPETRCLAQDPQMAEWALQDWARASGGKLQFEKTTNIRRANIRVHWASQNEGLYGEARPFIEDGIRGAEVYVLPDLSAMGRDISSATRVDSLLRDAIVYLTCLHETGHALGLSHTSAFADIMYTFSAGGDIPEYFGRYRRRLAARADIEKTSGLSARDRERLLEVLAGQ